MASKHASYQLIIHSTAGLMIDTSMHTKGSMDSGKQVSHIVNGKQLQLGLSHSADRYEVLNHGIRALHLHRTTLMRSVQVDTVSPVPCADPWPPNKRRLGWLTQVI